MSCPRCGRATPPTVASCPGCGAPLALPDEPAPRALDVSLSLDRRAPGRTPPPLAGAEPWLVEPASSALRGETSSPPEPRPPAALPRAPRAPRDPAADRSHWDLGAAVPPAPEGPEREAVREPAPELPEPDVAEVEVHLRRATSLRRALAWAIDLGPFLAGAVTLARALLAEAVGAPSARGLGPDGLVDLLAREAGIVVPVAALLVVALFVYATLAHALAGATLGKWIARIRVAGPGGGRPSLGRSAARSALAVLSVALLGLGLLAALFTRSGRALHDVAASTWVVEA